MFKSILAFSFISFSVLSVSAASMPMNFRLARRDGGSAYSGVGGESNGGNVNKFNRLVQNPLLFHPSTLFIRVWDWKRSWNDSGLANLNILNIGSGNAGNGGDASSGSAVGGSGCGTGSNGGSAYTGTSPFSCGMRANEIGKGGQANGGSVNEVNNGWVLFLRHVGRGKERMLIVGCSTSTPLTLVLGMLEMGEMQVPETL